MEKPAGDGENSHMGYSFRSTPTQPFSQTAGVTSLKRENQKVNNHEIG